MIDLYDKISAAIDNKEVSESFFVDLSKAFDTEDHDILFTKLGHYGVRGDALDWIKTHLSNRFQFVQYNKSTSSFEPINTCADFHRGPLWPLTILDIHK